MAAFRLRRIELDQDSGGGDSTVGSREKIRDF